MRSIKDINIKNRAYYFYNDMINITKLDSSLLKLDKKSHKNISAITLVISQKKINIQLIV